MQRTLIFDLDGTLSDNFEGIANCIVHACERMGRTPPARETLARFVGPPLRDTFRGLIAGAAPEDVEQAISFYRERYSVSGWHENVLYPHVAETLRALGQRGHRLFVCTSKPRVFARRIIEHFGLEPLFGGIYGADLDGGFDDKSKLLAHLLDSEGVERDRAFMIGDRAQDVRAANANGMAAIGALWGYGSREELAAAGGLVFASEPPDLLALSADVVPGRKTVASS
jgi:phosphoglycolate phosphatase